MFTKSQRKKTLTKFLEVHRKTKDNLSSVVNEPVTEESMSHNNNCTLFCDVYNSNQNVKS